MITDQLIRTRFVHDVMSKGINTIYETQEQVVRKNLKIRSGNLLSHLQSRPFTSSSSDGKDIYYIRIFPYIRFLDINYRRGNDRISRHVRSNMALYNRVVWGVLYHETFPEIQYGFTEQVRSSIRKELEQAAQYEQSSNW